MRKYRFFLILFELTMTANYETHQKKSNGAS